MKAALQRQPLGAYFCLTFALSWGGALTVLLPRISRGEVIPAWYGLLTFPVMLVGPALSGLGLTAVVDGRSGMRQLSGRLRRWRMRPGWYLTALFAPGTLLVVLFGLAATVSDVFAPHLFLMGFLFGPIAGYLEEIGWTGFALPRTRARFGEWTGSLVLGAVWGVGTYRLSTSWVRPARMARI